MIGYGGNMVSELAEGSHLGFGLDMGCIIYFV